MHERRVLIGAGLFALAVFAGPGQAGDRATEAPRLGRPPSAEVVRRMDITVAADGSGLPAGSGSVAEGRAVFQAKCAACHGAAGEGDLADRLTGGVGTLGSAKPVKTVASYWPYAPTLFDYIRRAMPLDAPQSLENDEVYGLVAYLLSIDGIVAPDARLDAPGLSRVVMPNRDGFVRLDADGFDGNIERVGRTRRSGE
jgi:S-disulfanyl-L-cysteine oxidoreductase SoxD